MHDVGSGGSDKGHDPTFYAPSGEGSTAVLREEQSDKDKVLRGRVEQRDKVEKYNFRHIFFSVMFGALLSLAYVALKRSKEEGRYELDSLPPSLAVLIHKAMEAIFGMSAMALGAEEAGSVMRGGSDAEGSSIPTGDNMKGGIIQELRP